MSFYATTFNNKYDVTPRTELTTFDSLAQWLESQSVTRAPRSRKDEGYIRMFNLGMHNGSPSGSHARGSVLTHCSGVILDIESKGALPKYTIEDATELVERLDKLAVQYCIYETAQSTPENMRLRVVLPFHDAVLVSVYDMAGTTRAAARSLGVEAYTDPCSWGTLTQRYFAPFWPLERTDEPLFAVNHLGDTWTPIEHGAQPQASPKIHKPTTTVNPRMGRGNIGVGNRNTTLKNRVLWCLGRTPCVEGVRQVNLDDIAHHIAMYDQNLHKTPLFTDPTEHISKTDDPPRKFVENILKSASASSTYSPIVYVEDTQTHDRESGLPLGGEEVDFDTADKGNADRFLLQYGDHVKFAVENEVWWCFVPELGKWEQGNCRAEEYAKGAFMASIDNEIKHAHSLGNDDLIKRLTKARTYATRASSVSGALRWARSQPGVGVRQDVFDPESSWTLLNCTNGTIDLRTGELREHRAEDLITLSTGTAFRADADTSLIERVVADIFPAEEDQDFIQRWFGYNLQAMNPEKAILVLYGPTANNGKSTILDAVAHALGDYATAAAPETLLEQEKRGGAGHQEDIACLEGKRMVHTSELPEGRKLNESRVKALTGGVDKIKASRKGEKTREFYFAGKVSVATNNLPELSSDAGVLSRLLILPCTQRFDEPDRMLPEKLRAAKEGVLLWLVRGYQKYMQRGLDKPTSVKESLADVALDCSPVKQFTDAALQYTRAASDVVYLKELYKALENWCRLGDCEVPTRKAFARELGRVGIKLVRSTGNSKAMRGYRLTNEGMDLLLPAPEGASWS